MNKDIKIIRDLAKEVKEIANKPIQDKRRDLWRKHNSFCRVRTPIYVRAFAYNEIFDFRELKCEDPFFRDYEYMMHCIKFRDTIGDDFIVEPWLKVDPIYERSPKLRWGVKVSLGEKNSKNGAASFSPSLLEEEDIEKLIIPEHKINEKKTKELFDKLHNAIGDIINIHLNRGPMLSMWKGDISTDIARMRGLEQIMWDAYDRPDWLHKLLTHIRDGVLKVHEEAEKAGDFSLANHENQAMPYTKELRDPKANVYGVKRNELWWYMASQEYTTFGPDMFYEFLLQYQIPIMEKFGLISYGCCEDLTHKIDYLRKLPNLRRIAVTPFANAQKCSEQIGSDYVLSWRPNPSDMISTGLDKDFVKKVIRDHCKIFRTNNNYFDITLKDVHTINHQPENIKKWIKIVLDEVMK